MFALTPRVPPLDRCGPAALSVGECAAEKRTVTPLHAREAQSLRTPIRRDEPM